MMKPAVNPTKTAEPATIAAVADESSDDSSTKPAMPKTPPSTG